MDRSESNDSINNFSFAKGMKLNIQKLSSYCFVAAMIAPCWAMLSFAANSAEINGMKIVLTPHRLDQIQLSAENFISAENEKHKTNLQLDKINLKTFVPDCAVPLKANWAPKDRVQRKSVAVICTKSVSKDILKTWSVYIPMTVQKSEQIKLSR